MALTVYNDTRSISVDSHYKNLVLYKKIKSTEMVKTLSGYPFRNKYGQYDFKVPSYNLGFPRDWDNLRNDYPVVPTYAYFYDLQSEMRAGLGMPLVAAEVTPEGYGAAPCVINLPFDRGFGVLVITENEEPFDVYLFTHKVPRESADTGFGLEVFNEDGEKVFDSQNGYLQIIDEYTAGQKVAVMLNGATHGETELIYSNFAWVRGLAIRNNKLKHIRYFQRAYGAGAYKDWPPPEHIPFAFMVDVTNL